MTHIIRTNAIAFAAGRYCVGVPNPVANPYSLFRALRIALLRNTCPAYKIRFPGGHRAPQFAAIRSQTRTTALIIFRRERTERSFCGADKQIKVSGTHRGESEHETMLSLGNSQKLREDSGARLKRWYRSAAVLCNPLCPRRGRVAARNLFSCNPKVCTCREEDYQILDGHAAHTETQNLTKAELTLVSDNNVVRYKGIILKSPTKVLSDNVFTNIILPDTDRV